MSGKVIPLSQAYPERRPDQVTTFDLLSTSTIGFRSNPDTLVGRHGLTIYSKMANDEQVKAVLNFKRDAITARGWQFKYRDDCPLDEDEQALRRRVFTEAVARMRGAFSDALNAIMTGRAYGFSITEKVYGEITVDGKEWPAINMLLGRDPLSFRFYTDEYGTLEKIEQQTQRSGLVEVDRARVIHYVHAPEWDHVYGRSDLREAYRSWYIKDQISNLWPMYLERFAGGFIHASIPAGVDVAPADLEALDEALKKAKSLGAIRTPPGVVLTVHQPGSTDGYERAIQYHDLAIAKALLVPNLLGISNAGNTGAYAQSQTQLEAFFWTLNADASRLEECLNEQLFRDLGDQAWADGEYPEFKFKPASLEHVKWVIQTWSGLLGAKAVVPTEEDETFLRKLLEMPPRDEGSTVLENPIEKQAREDAAKQQEAAAAAQQELAIATAKNGAPPDAEDAGEDAAADEEDDATESKKPTPVGKGKTTMARLIEDSVRRVLMEYDESKHPRGSDGKWADGAGGGDKLLDSRVPSVAKAYKSAYEGYDPAVTTPDGKEGAHVFEFDNEDKLNEFLDKVGGAPHPSGGMRAILEGRRLIDPHVEHALLEAKARANKGGGKTFAADWDEAKHPRAKDGKFGESDSTGAGADKGIASRLLEKAATGTRTDRQKAKYLNEMRAKVGDERMDEIAQILEKHPVQGSPTQHISKLWQEGTINFEEMQAVKDLYSLRAKYEGYDKPYTGWGKEAGRTNPPESLEDKHETRGKYYPGGGKTFAADWEEDKHPRATDGKFAPVAEPPSPHQRNGLSSWESNSRRYQEFITERGNFPLPKPVEEALDDWSFAPELDPDQVVMIEEAIQAQGIDLKETDTLYRGLSMSSDQFANLRFVGAQLKARNLQSVTTDSGMTTDFATMTTPDGHVNVLLEIQPVGLRALPVIQSGQSELLLSKGASMVVASKPIKDPKYPDVWRVKVRARD